METKVLVIGWRFQLSFRAQARSKALKDTAVTQRCLFAPSFTIKDSSTPRCSVFGVFT